MPKNLEAVPAQKAQVVYCVVRYGQLVGVYADYSDATDVQRLSLEKGQICDLIPKVVVPSSKTSL